MNNINISLISQQDIRETGCFDIASIIAVMEDVLRKFKAGRVLLPDKISQIFHEETQDRINCMPATLLDENVCGVKWVSVFPENPHKFGCSNVSGVIILSELERGYPFAIVDGTLLTALRTACMGAIAAKNLANEDSSVIGIIGSGEQAKMHFMTMKHVLPSITTCKVASRTKESEERFIQELQVQYPDVSFVPCNGRYDEAPAGADVIVTAVSCQEPLLKASVIKPGAFYCHVGGWEDEYAVPLKADKIVCDRWDAVKHRSQTISRLYKMGKLTDENIYADIADIVAGDLPGRERKDEFIYFNSVGLAFIDVAVAYSFYQKAHSQGKGTNWTL